MSLCMSQFCTSSRYEKRVGWVTQNHNGCYRESMLSIFETKKMSEKTKNIRSDICDITTDKIS